jgi:hypothetical protein
MDSDRSLSEASDQISIATPAVVERHGHHLKAAPLHDVMFDQLGYLIAHADGNCPPDSMDCARLQQVKNWLLLPFRSIGG